MNNDLMTYHKDRWMAHASSRAMERYGIAFTPEVQQELIKHYDSGSFTILLTLESNPHRKVVQGVIDGTKVTFVYDELHNSVITFLHNTWVKTDAIDVDELYISKRREERRKRKKRRNYKKRSGQLRQVRGANYRRTKRVDTDYLGD